MFKKIFLSLFLVSAVSILIAQKTPESVDAILKEAYATALKENKKPFILFHASWCTWCRKMDSSLNDISCKKYFDDNFVVRHLTVYEDAQHKSLETPGALELLTKYKGEKLGLPYWLIFDVKGNLIGEAKMPTAQGEPEKSTGCPATPEEVDYFIELLKKITTLKDDELEIIRKRFKKNEVQYKNP